MNSLSADLPHVDEHSLAVAASADEVWPALVRTAEASFGGGFAPRFARLVGCEDVADGGPRPLQAGSVLPGSTSPRRAPRSCWNSPAAITSPAMR